MMDASNLSCDWSTRFMKVILLGLSLVRTIGSTTDPSIVCAPQVCVGSVKLYSIVQLCTQKYSPSVQVVYSSTEYLYMNLFI